MAGGSSLGSPLTNVTVQWTVTPNLAALSKREIGVRFEPVTATDKKNNHPTGWLFFLAGAERLELSTRGFGDRCSTN